MLLFNSSTTAVFCAHDMATGLLRYRALQNSSGWNWSEPSAPCGHRCLSQVVMLRQCCEVWMWHADVNPDRCLLIQNSRIHAEVWAGVVRHVRGQSEPCTLLCTSMRQNGSL